MVIRKIIYTAVCFMQMLEMWKSILYGDISWYGGLPEGSAWLSARDALEIAWIVWMT